MAVPSQDSVRVMYMCIRVPVTILLTCMCQTKTKFGSCIRYVYEGSCQYSIKMYGPSQDNVRVMYMCKNIPATILLRYMCQDRKMFGSCICVRGCLSIFY